MEANTYSFAVLSISDHSYLLLSYEATIKIPDTSRISRKDRLL